MGSGRMRDEKGENEGWEVGELGWEVRELGWEMGEWGWEVGEIKGGKWRKIE